MNRAVKHHYLGRVRIFRFLHEFVGDASHLPRSGYFASNDVRGPYAPAGQSCLRANPSCVVRVPTFAPGSAGRLHAGGDLSICVLPSGIAHNRCTLLAARARCTLFAPRCTWDRQRPKNRAKCPQNVGCCPKNALARPGSWVHFRAPTRGSFVKGESLTPE